MTMHQIRYEYTNMIHAVDWMPTLLRAAGVTSDMFPELAELDGVDQVPVRTNNYLQRRGVTKPN